MGHPDTLTTTVEEHVGLRQSLQRLGRREVLHGRPSKQDGGRAVLGQPLELYQRGVSLLGDDDDLRLPAGRGAEPAPRSSNYFGGVVVSLFEESEELGLGILASQHERTARGVDGY